MWFMLVQTVLAQETVASETKFAGTEKAATEAEAPETDLSLEMGGAYATGNSEYYTINGLLKASHRWSANRIAVDGGVNVGKSVVDADANGILDDAERNAGKQESARKYFGNGRYDRFLSDKDSLYLLGGALVDRFAGYDLRTNEQFGYSRMLIKNDSTQLVSELGLDYAQENYITEVEATGVENQNIFAGRLMVGLQHAFNENVTFSETAEVYENLKDFEDLRVIHAAVLSSKLSDVFSIKLSHQLLFDNVPVEGYQPADQTVLTTLVASLM